MNVDVEEYAPSWQIQSYTPIPMVGCTRAHFNFSEEIMEKFDRMEISGALCPDLGYQMELKGKPHSDQHLRMHIGIGRCYSSDPLCVDDATFQTYQAN